MSSSSFNLLIQTPDHEAYHGPADLVTLSSDIGEMQILPGHASLLATITYTPIQLRNGGMTMDFILRQGFVFVDQQRNTVRVLGLACEKTEEVNEVTAKEYLAFVLSTLDKPEELNAYQLRHLEGQKLALEKQFGE